MKSHQRSLEHYFYLLVLFVLSIWLTQLISINYPLSIFSMLFFTMINIVFGIRDVTILDNGIEKKYRYTFIFSIICLLVSGPAATVISSVSAALIYIPISQIKRIGRIDFPAFFLNLFTSTISLSIMSAIFFYCGGKIAQINFPYNIYAIIFAVAANFVVNTLLIAFWLILGDNRRKFLDIISKEFLWLIKYDFWQAIYAILIVNTYWAFTNDIIKSVSKNYTSTIGIYDFFILGGVIIAAFIFYYPLEENRKSFNLLISYNRQNVELRKLSDKLLANNKRIIRAFMSMLEKRDPYTSGHSERVALYSKIIARHLGFDESKCSTLEMAAILHDIGKIGVDINILNKSESLTDEEFEAIKKHPLYGVEILQKMYKGNSDDDDDEFKMICDIANSHHERYDGTGYPYAISGENITLEARIIAVADTFDAMTSDRSYRKSLPFEKAIQEICDSAGTQLCPKVVNAFKECVNNGSLHLSKDENVANLLEIFS